MIHTRLGTWNAIQSQQKLQNEKLRCEHSCHHKNISAQIELNFETFVINIAIQCS